MYKRRTQKIKSVSKFFTYIILLLVVVFLCGFFAVFTNGFRTDFKTFYVEYNNSQMLGDVNNLTLSPNTDLKFDCKYTLGFLDKTQQGYSIKIIPNANDKTDFDYYVDDRAYWFSEITDMSTAFNVQIYDTYFTINLADESMTDILSRLYRGQTVTKVPTLHLTEISYFSLIVTSYDKETRIKINFLIQVDLESIEIDKGDIIL